MNRLEWELQYRLWRSARSCINRSKVRKGLSRKELSAVWDIFWDGVYKKMPEPVYYAIMNKPSRLHGGPWDITSREAIRCNMDHLPNSWPRTDCRNTGLAN